MFTSVRSGGMPSRLRGGLDDADVGLVGHEPVDVVDGDAGPVERVRAPTRRRRAPPAGTPPGPHLQVVLAVRRRSRRVVGMPAAAGGDLEQAGGRAVAAEVPGEEPGPVVGRRARARPRRRRRRRGCRCRGRAGRRRARASRRRRRARGRGCRLVSIDDADDELVDEPGAAGVEVERAAAQPRPSPTNAPVCGMSCSGVAVATMSRSMSSGVSPACLIAAAPASIARRRGRLAGAGDAALADAGALDDPLVAGVDALLEVGVGEPLLGERRCPSRRSQARIAQATRSQATGWPSRRRSPGWTSMPISLPRNGLQTGVEVPGPSRCADGLAVVDEVALVDVVERHGTRPPTGRRSCARERGGPRRGSREPPWVTRPPMVVGMSSGVGDVADGDVGHAALGERREHRAVADFEERGRRRARRACPWSSASAPGPRRARRGGRASRRRRRRRPRRGSTRPAPRARRTSTSPSSAASPAAASAHQRRVERAADVERRDPLHAELLGPGRRRRRARRACRRSRPGRARCRWRPSTPSGAAVHASSACSRVAPSSAAMRPGCASAAAWVSSARRAAKRTPSSRGSAPAAMSAVTWPSEWPANATGASASGCIASQATSEVSSTASCAFAGAGERSAGASRTRWASGSPSAASARSTTAHAGWSRHGAAHAGLLAFPGRGRRPRHPLSDTPPAAVESESDTRVRRRGYIDARASGCMRV